MCELCNNSITTNTGYDPTRTTTLRNSFSAAMGKRFNSVLKAIYNKCTVEKFFDTQKNVLFNTNESSTEKIAAFMLWLHDQLERGVLSAQEYNQIEKAWTDTYIMDAYIRGIKRARYEMIKAGMNIPTIDESGGEYVVQSTPTHNERLNLLFARVFSDLKGITTALESQVNRVLSQSLADGDKPKAIAAKIMAVIIGIGAADLGVTKILGQFVAAKRRAEMLARTEIIRAHNQANVQEYMNWGVQGVNMMAEFVTAGDDRVCSKCEELASYNPYTLTEAMNIVPVHPNCRCIFIPFILN